MKDRSSGTMLLDSVPFPLGFLDFFFFFLKLSKSCLHEHRTFLSTAA